MELHFGTGTARTPARNAFKASERGLFGCVMGKRRDVLAKREQYAGDPSGPHEKVSALMLLQHPWPVSLQDALFSQWA